MLDRVLDGLWDAWEWLGDDLESKGAEDEVNAVSDQLTTHERATVQVIRSGFLLLETVMLVGIFVSMVFFMIIGMQLLGPVGILAGIPVPPLIWLLLRKPRALLKSALLRSVVRRVGRRAALVLASASAPGSPVAVPVDVDANVRVDHEV